MKESAVKGQNKGTKHADTQDKASGEARINEKGAHFVVDSYLWIYTAWAWQDVKDTIEEVMRGVVPETKVNIIVLNHFWLQ